VRVLLTLPPPGGHYRVPPLGLLYLAGALRRAGHDVFLHDPAVEPGGLTAFADRVRRLQPGMVGVSAHSADWGGALRMLEAVGAAAPGAVRVAGGAHVSADPAAVAGDLPAGRPDIEALVQFAVAGEGEGPIVDLAAALASGGDPSGIPGLVIPGGPIPAVRFVPEDLDALAPPAWDLAPPDRYRGAPQGFAFRRLPIAPILTSRGCPYACTFCGGAAVTGRRFRARSPASVRAEVEGLVARFGVREVHIVDDAFATRRDRALAILAHLGALKVTLSFPNGLRADAIDDEMADALRRAGTHTVNLGIESGSPAVLARVYKSLDLSAVRSAATRLRRAGIEVGGFFLLGLPGETVADVRQTLRLALDLPLDRAHFSAFLPLPGTEATRQAMAEGGPMPDASSLRYDAVPWAPAAIGRPRLKALQREAFLRFHVRPRVLFGLARSVRTPAHAVALLSRAAGYLGRGPR